MNMLESLLTSFLKCIFYLIFFNDKNSDSATNSNHLSYPHYLSLFFLETKKVKRKEIHNVASKPKKNILKGMVHIYDNLNYILYIKVQNVYPTSTIT